MGGKLQVLFQPFEAVIILGAAAGAFVIANSGTVLKQTVMVLGTLFRGPRYNKAACLELLGVQYAIFKLVQSKGVLALEQHIEAPYESELFRRFPTFARNHHAVEFMCDYLRMVTLGTRVPHEMEALMDEELETHHQENERLVAAIQSLADGTPALGTVAAVLGVIKTMGSISEPPEVLGPHDRRCTSWNFPRSLCRVWLFCPHVAVVEEHLRDRIQVLPVNKGRTPRSYLRLSASGRDRVCSEVPDVGRSTDIPRGRRGDRGHFRGRIMTLEHTQAKRTMRLSAFPILLAVVLFTVALAGCSSLIAKDQLPLSSRTSNVLAAMDTSAAAPMLVRVFKESSELEVWKPDRSGQYRLFKSYAICKWSGELGPKIKEGDYQSPEGFYDVTPAMMNPKSSYYLSFNTGFPNKFDRAQGRTGTNLMIHGDCKSVGCYAMTDDQMQEIYALARESFNGGNPSFKLELYPFRMTERNLTRYATNPNIVFWRNLKQGYHVLEIRGRPADVDVCEGKYVFDIKSGMPTDPRGKCPASSET